MSFFVERLQGKSWEYESEFLDHDIEDTFTALSKRETAGWEILNITGNESGESVIWFKRKITKPLPKPKSPRCKHHVGYARDGVSNCIYCGPRP